MLRFARLPPRALRTVRDVLDRDEDFRARVTASADEQQLDRASWLFLARPDGWSDELELLRAAADEEADSARQSREEQRAERRAAQLEETVARLRAELEQLRAALDLSERTVADERGAREEAERERQSLSEKVSGLEQERARAVRSLKQTEATAAGRLEQVRELQVEVDRLTGELDTSAAPAEAPPAPPPAAPSAPAEARPAPVPHVEPSPWADRDPTRVAEAVARAGEAANLLAAALAQAAAALGPDADPSGRIDRAPGSSTPGAETETAAARRDRSDHTDGAAPTRPPRRTPVRLRQGVHEGTAEGLEQLLRTAGIVAVVDGYNVAMEGWPNLGAAEQRESLVAALGTLRARVPAELHLVFDGEASGGRPAVGAPLPVRVHFSAGDQEADDLILEMVADLPTDVPVLVVSSDRRVADGARRLGANAVRSAQLLELIRR